jgi:hypothetical protein
MKPHLSPLRRPLHALCAVLCPAIVVPLAVADTPAGAPSAPAAKKAEVEWVTGYGSLTSDKTRAVAADKAGNVYMAGESSGEATFGSLSAPALGGMDSFVAKLSISGEPIWVRSFGGAKIDRAYGVVADSHGNVYVTGHFQSTDVQREGKDLTNRGDYDIFLIKYDAEGKELWVRTAGGTGYDYGHGVALDPDENVVITGAIQGEATFGTKHVNEGSTSRSIFAAKYSSDGALKWVTASSGIGGSGHGLGIDAKGSIYIGGSCGGTGNYGSVKIDALEGGAGLALKLSPSGEAERVTLFPGVGTTVHEICADETGRVWVAGMFKQRVQIGKTALTSSGPTNSDGFCAALDAQGNVLWAHGLHGEGVDYCLGVCTDGKGRSFFTGELSKEAELAGKPLRSAGGTDIFVAAFSPEGDLQWTEMWGGEKGDNAYTMAWHYSGFLVVGGACTGPASFGDKIMSRPNGAEAYAAKLRVRK